MDGIGPRRRSWRWHGISVGHGAICEILSEGRSALGRTSVALFRAIHQESDVVPENVDAVRALMGTESDWRASVARTDRNIAASFGQPMHRNMVD